MTIKPDDGAALFAKYVGERTVELEKDADAALDRIRDGQHWADWRAVADFLADGRRMAWEAAGRPGNSYDDGRYRKLFGRWLDLHSKYRDLDKATRAHLFWYVDNRSEVEGWRDTLAQNKRAALNHPTTLKRNFEAAQSIAKAKGTDGDAPRPDSKQALLLEVERLAREVRKRDDEIAWLKSAEGGGSLFDLKQDSVANIVRTIAGNVTFSRLVSLQKALAAEIARLKAEQKHAG
jgi:hypothetical protein